MSLNRRECRVRMLVAVWDASITSTEASESLLLSLCIHCPLLASLSYSLTIPANFLHDRSELGRLFSTYVRKTRARVQAR